MEKENVGVGIVGTGFMCKSHSNSYHKAGYLFRNGKHAPELIGIGATTQEKANDASSRYGFRYGSVGWEKLIQDPEIDLIDVCVGDSLHKQVAIEAATAGKAVLCEKPLALSIEDARAMVNAAEKRNVVNMCGYNYRFFPAVQLAKRLIMRCDIGRLYSFSGCYCQDVGADDRVPAERLWYITGPKASGVSNGIGSHLVDMSRFLMGNVASVSGRLKIFNTIRSSQTGEVRVRNDEEMLAVVDFVSGASGQYKASAVCGGRKNYLSWEIYGSKGSMTFDIENPNILNVYLRDSPLLEINGFTAVNVTQMDKNHPLVENFWPRGHCIGWEDAHVSEIAHMLECVSSGRSVAPEGATFEDGLRVVEILQAIRESSESGKRIDLQ